MKINLLLMLLSFRAFSAGYNQEIVAQNVIHEAFDCNLSENCFWNLVDPHGQKFRVIDKS